MKFFLSAIENPPHRNVVTTLTELPRLLKVIEPSHTTFEEKGLNWAGIKSYNMLENG